MSRIRVNIDRIALGGFDPAGRSALVEGLCSELVRILSSSVERAKWARSRSTPVIRIARIGVTPGPEGSRTFGIRLGHAIGRRLQS
jgi:hypothetical protein